MHSQFYLQIAAQSQVLKNEPRFISTAKNDLLISPVQVTDQGWYLCVANNSEGQSSDKVLLTVQKRPVIKVIPQTRDFKKYEDLVISCFVLDGIPQPTLRWMKDGQVIENVSWDLKDTKSCRTRKRNGYH